MKYLVLPLLVSITACAVQPVTRHLDRPWLDEAIPLDKTGPHFGLATQSVDKPWLVGAAVPLKKPTVWPAALRSTQTFSFSLEEPLPNLDELARRLSLLSDLSVFVSPQARLPPTHVRSNLQVAELVAEPVQRGGVILEQLRLPDLLHQIAALYGLSWRYQQGRIELYRSETQRFSVPVDTAPNPVSRSSP